MRLHDSLIALLLVVVGCGGAVVTVDGIDVYEDVWQDTIAEVGRIASFQMNCPAPQLQFTLLRRGSRLPEQVGVSGCGQRDVYTRIGRTWFASGQQAQAAAMQAQIDQRRRRAAAQQQLIH